VNILFIYLFGNAKDLVRSMKLYHEQDLSRNEDCAHTKCHTLSSKISYFIALFLNTFTITLYIFPTDTYSMWFNV